MEFTIDKLVKEVAEKALDEITYEGKTIREWVEILVKQQNTSCESCREQVLKHLEKEDWADTVNCVMNMPFINKPCVSEGICREDKIQVFDKIRAEIAEYGSICVKYAITDKTKTDEGIDELVTDVLLQAKRQVLDIIDKYKAESEVNNED